MDEITDSYKPLIVIVGIQCGRRVALDALVGEDGVFYFLTDQVFIDGGNCVYVDVRQDFFYKTMKLDRHWLSDNDRWRSLP